MMRTAAILLLALGAAAEVPHWVQKKPQLSFKMPNLPILSMQSRFAQQTPNSRRLQAIMSPECEAACPGVQDMIKAMMGGRRLDSHEKEDEGMDIAKLCPHVEAMKCSAKEAACQDGEEKKDGDDGAAMIECACACPKIADLGNSKDGGMEIICNDKAGTVGCITSEASCSAMASQMNPKEIDLGCEYTAKECEKKGEEMATCVGQEDMTTWGSKGCDKAESIKAEADTCCPIGKKLVDCFTADCLTLQLAMEKLKGETDDDMAATREACPDAGLPSDAAVDSAATSGSLTAAASADAADFANPGQTISMLAMAVALAACLIA